MSKPRIVIAGAGFGGLWALKTLAKAPVTITLIDKNNYHTFLPLLYQVAAAEIGADEIAYPLRNLLRKIPDARFVMANITDIDWEHKMVLTSRAPIAFDYLILALGSRVHYFKVSGAAEYAYPLRTMSQAIRLRHRILEVFERASLEKNPERRTPWLTFIIVGGGPTGVEFTGALTELVRGSLCKDYPTLHPDMVQIHLLEATEHLLPGFPPSLQDYTRRRLEKMGVKVHLNRPVAEVTAMGVKLQDQTFLQGATVVWTAGMQGALAQSWGLPTGPRGLIPVEPTLQVPGKPEVYVIGDSAYCEQNGRPLPMIAPVAVQQGQTAARNILRQIQGREPLPFRYRDQGTLVTIGRNAAAAHLFGRNFTGFIAWVLWLLIHLAKLIGFRNRLFVLLDWAWDYFFFERTMRLILPGDDGGSSKEETREKETGDRTTADPDGSGQVHQGD